MGNQRPRRPTKHFSTMANRALYPKSRKYQNDVALPFEQVLPEAVIQKVLRAKKSGKSRMLYTPIVVMIWAYRCQVLDADKSLNNAVKRVLAWIAAAARQHLPAIPEPIVKARKRLPEIITPEAHIATNHALTAEVKPAQRSLWATSCWRMMARTS